MYRQTGLRVLSFFCLALVLGKAVAGVGLPGPAGERDGLGWLTDMRQAAFKLDYKGTVTYVKDDQVDSFNLFHAYRDGQEQERLVSINSPLREVVRAAGNVTRYAADGQKILVETKPSSRSLLVELPDDPAVLTRYYRINLRGQEFIAGHLCQVVALEPRDEYRYTRLLWVDTVSRLPLKLDVINEDGQSVEQMVFTTLDTRSQVTSKDLEPVAHASMGVTQVSHRETLALESLNWTLMDVPDGFQMVSYVRLKRPPADVPVEHLLLSDGFSSVSVYLEKSGAAASKGARRVGAINVDTVLVHGYLITVMGEVPAKTVQRIAKGLHYKQNGGS